MKDEWKIVLKRTKLHEGKLVYAYGIVYDSSKTARGSIELRGNATSNLLEILLMSSSVPLVLVDCSKPVTTNAAPSYLRRSP